MDRGDVFGDPRSEGADQAVACGGNPGNKITCVYRKLKSGRNDGEARRGWGVNE